MNKTLLSAALIAGFGIAALVPQTTEAANTSSGTISFTGTLTASTCTVAVNGSTSTLAIALPTTPLVNGVLSTAGSSAGWTAVTLTLSSCTSLTGYTKVFPYFTGTGIDTTTGYLSNTGTATNVEVALSNGQSLTNVLTLQGASGAQNAGTQLLSAATPTFAYYAGYVAPTAAATAGSVAASVQYNLNYQ
ncbi:type 1 fimbrial protein [Rhodanobacter sp. A1T4]|jgi:major type 1 subunit fimbrin (pilin)|uniref:fimbrial protein n=1 Tax=Rhodanobacter sp. A1T4 TaxID=2723087 RepID=UPI0016187074|nr:type 1 fimbrial protein [Rhodanobacter sp. A1T4]MBB6248051.1 major type 1 subunit fimbrin (pilin) [Rhodanobacter sp. A1T4]